MFILEFAKRYPHAIECTPGMDHCFLARVAATGCDGLDKLDPATTEDVLGFGSSHEEALMEASRKAHRLDGFVETFRIFYLQRWGGGGSREPVEYVFEADETDARARYRAEQEKMWGLGWLWTTSGWAFGRVENPGHITDLTATVVAK